MPTPPTLVAVLGILSVVSGIELGGFRLVAVAVRDRRFLERQRQIEDGLRAGAHDGDRRAAELEQIRRHVERRAAVHFLPLVTPDELPGKLAEFDLGLALDALRILVVDDDPGQRSLLDSFLKSQGFATTLAASSAKGGDPWAGGRSTYRPPKGRAQASRRTARSRQA